jgi:hypothetical protein
MTSQTDNQPDELVPDPQVSKELSVTLMTIWRWDRDPEMVALGWPPPVYIRKRKYRGSSGPQRGGSERGARRGDRLGQRIGAEATSTQSTCLSVLNGSRCIGDRALRPSTPTRAALAEAIAQ